jgi:hypothetical protein
MSLKKTILRARTTHIHLEAKEEDCTRKYSTMLRKRVAPHRLIDQVLHQNAHIKGVISSITITYS